MAPYRHRRDRPRLQKLSERLNGWLRDDLSALEAAEPVMPVEDRAADTWEPLIAIADHAGANWPHRARTALPRPPRRKRRRPVRTHPPPRRLPHRLRLGTGAAHPAAPPTPPSRPRGPVGRLRTTRRRTHRTTARELLSEYGIQSGTVRFTQGRAKGYRRDSFDDAWARYTPELVTDSNSPWWAPREPALTLVRTPRDDLRGA
ncbi:DNA primase [Pseudonocardia sp. Ae717_Ps2]|nr:DNA primase [Pseudonocardia sp. Ae717_Ps2]